MVGGGGGGGGGSSSSSSSSSSSNNNKSRNILISFCLFDTFVIVCNALLAVSISIS